MKYSLLIAIALLSLSACKFETKSSAELLFPLGEHTWSKGEDFLHSPPSDTCTGCPTFDLASPNLHQLRQDRWRVELPPGETSMKISGLVTGFAEHAECGDHNDLLCDSAWRVWPPDSDDSVVRQSTPGDDLRDNAFVLHPSFECGISRFVLVAQNTYGTSRLIFEVERSGGVCDSLIEGPTIRIILKWNERDTDLDLHLIQGDGVFGDAQQDCYFQNCQPTTNPSGTSGLDWGQPGRSADNPFLDVDDDTNAGPENIFLYGAMDGRYTIDVHYHPDSIANPRVLPDIEVWADGDLVDWLFYDINHPEFRKNMIWTPANLLISGGRVTLEPVDTIRHY